MLIDDIRTLTHVGNWGLREKVAAADNLRALIIDYDALAPDWSQAPEWARWYAIDADGYSSWYDNDPILIQVTSDRREIGPHWSHHGAKGIIYDAHNLPLGLDWRLCIWQRPEAT